MRLLFVLAIGAGLALTGTQAFAQNRGGGHGSHGGPRQAHGQARLDSGQRGLQSARSLPGAGLRGHGRRGGRDVDYGYARAVDAMIETVEAELDRFLATPRAGLLDGDGRAMLAGRLEPLVAILPDEWVLPDYGEPGATSVRSSPLTDLKAALVSLRARLTADEAADDIAASQLYSAAKRAERQIDRASALIDRELAAIDRAG